MCPAWSPCEHQLTLALSPIWGPASEATPSAGGYLQSSQEVIYSLNDSCSYFTQRLFLPKLPQPNTCTIFSRHSPSSILIIHHIQIIFTSFNYEIITPSLLQFLLAGRLLSVFYVRHNTHAACTCCMSIQHLHAACPFSISMLHAHSASSCCMSLLHVRAACPCFMPMLIVNAACLCINCSCCKSLKRKREIGSEMRRKEAK